MPPQTITLDQLQIIIDQTNARYMVALLLLLGMVSILLGTLLLAVGWRKTGFLFVAAYGAMMSFIGVGLCYLFGPIIIIFALGGIAREWCLPVKQNTAR